jgi:hypothetical protein
MKKKAIITEEDLDLFKKDIDTLMKTPIWNVGEEDEKRAFIIKTAVDAQAEDTSLWFMSERITEAYLQQSLRWLHRVIESGDPEALNSILTQSQDHSG